MIRIRSVALMWGALVLAGGLAACGSTGSSSVGPASSGSGSSSTAPVSSGPQTVMIKGFQFHPANLTVKPGTKVTFTNEDSTTHTASSAAGPMTISSGNLAKGQSYTVTFTKPGTYSYICDIHQYMKGSITVR